MYLYAAILRLADMEAYLLIPIGLQLFILSVLPGMPCFHRHHRCVQFCCVRPNSLLGFTLHVVSVPQLMSWAWFCPLHCGRSSDTQPCAEWPGRSAAYHFHLRWSVCCKEKQPIPEAVGFSSCVWNVVFVNQKGSRVPWQLLSLEEAESKPDRSAAIQYLLPKVVLCSATATVKWFVCIECCSSCHF